MGKARIVLRPTPVLRKQVGQMMKLLGTWEKNPTKRDPVARMLDPGPTMTDGHPEFLNRTRYLPSKHITRRQLVLNRHFTEIISDVLTNSFYEQFSELGITITSIETKAWNKGVSIFYYSTKRKFDAELHAKLNLFVPELLQSITEIRLIGRTPHLSFVYDNSTLKEQLLESSMSKLTVENPLEERCQELTTTGTRDVYATKDLGANESRLIGRKFSAPPDMSNSAFGLDYAKFYDDVAAHLDRGRAESSRMMPKGSVFAFSKPLFREPNEDQSQQDPIKRLKKMQSFVVSQRKKTEASLRRKRKLELIHRDSYKWDSPSNESADENVETLEVEDIK